jgi:putative addiction module component (TIGR02574 family)
MDNQSFPPRDWRRSWCKHYFVSFLGWVYDRDMNNATTIPIESFTVAEKLLLMERLWEDLSKRPSNVAPPEWHGDVLAARLAAVKEGRTELVDWDAAKERLRNRFK